LIPTQEYNHSKLHSAFYLPSKSSYIYEKLKLVNRKTSFKDKTREKIHKMYTSFQLSGMLEETCAFAELCYLCLVESWNIK